MQSCSTDFEVVRPVGTHDEALRELANRLRLREPFAQLLNETMAGCVPVGRNGSVSLLLRLHRNDRRAFQTVLRPEARRDSYGFEEHRDRDSAGAMLDIGGHVGLAALAFHALHPLARVHVFEPAPLSFFYLAWNALANNASETLLLHNAGLSSDGRPFVLEFAPDDSTSSRRAELGATWGRLPKQQHLVPTKRLTDVLDGCTGSGGRPLRKTLAVLKMDCEGCEFDLVPHEPAFFGDLRFRLASEYHEYHTKRRGHEARNASLLTVNAISQSKAVLCGRTWACEDRIAWLHGCKRTQTRWYNTTRATRAARCAASYRSSRHALRLAGAAPDGS